jgi:hypothetical protein
MTPEETARATVDDLLTQCGWIVQDYRAADFSAGRGNRELQLAVLLFDVPKPSA